VSVFTDENENVPATDLHYLMYTEGRLIWKWIIQKNQEQWRATFELAQRRRLDCTWSQGTPILRCLNTAPGVKSTLSTEKEPCKSWVPIDVQRNLRI
jgi:hypothetical protein